MKPMKKKKFRKSTVKPHHRIFVCGQTRSGKSVFADTLLHYFAQSTLVILIDTKREYSHIRELTDWEDLEKHKGLYRITELEYNGHEIHDDFIITEFVSQILFERGNCVLAVEEIGSIIPKAGKLYDRAPNFARLVQQGMGRGCGVISISQRPQEVHTTVLSQSQHIFIFFLQSKHDRKAVENYLDKEYFEKLNRFEFFHINFPKAEQIHCYKLYEGQMYKSLDWYSRHFGRSI